MAAVIGVVILVATVLIVVRLLVPRPGVAPGVAVAFGTWLVLALFASADQIDLVPTPHTVERFAETSREGAHAIWIGRPPLDAGPGIVLLVVAGAAALLIFADLCVSVEVPVVSGLALLTPWLPGVVLGYHVSWWSVVLTAGPWLVLLADVGRLRWPGRAAAAGWSALAVVVALACTPLVTTIPGWGVAMRLLPSSQTISVSQDLNLDHDLLAQSDRVAFEYTLEGATASDVGPLRLFTTTTFDGTSWSVSPGPVQDRSTGVLGPPTTGATTPVVVQVQVAGLSEHYLPVTTASRTVELDRPWQYDSARDLVWLPQRTDKAVRYTMAAELPTWTSEQLRTSRTANAPAGALDVPVTAHGEQIAEQAAQVSAGATTAYDQALALQNWLRSEGGFTYSTAAPEPSDDAVWTFLGARRGYCMHYATTMVVMARTQGIGARLAVGFLPGELTDGVHKVVERHAHAWPELWFDDVGWVRFEPTPSQQSGTPPGWAPAPTSTDEQNTTTTEPATTAPATAATDAAPPPVRDPAAPGSTDQRTGSRWPVALAVITAVAGLVVLVVLVVRRRSRAAPTDPEAAWVRVRQAFAATQTPWPASATPRQVLALALPALVPGDVDDDAVRGALTALATTVESLRYARPGAPAPDGAVVAAWVTTIETGLRRHRGAGVTGRDGGSSAPRTRP